MVTQTTPLPLSTISHACSIASIERFIPISFTRVFAIDYTEEAAEVANALRFLPYATGDPPGGGLCHERFLALCDKRFLGPMRGQSLDPIQQATPERNVETCPTRSDTACPNEQFLGETRKHGEIFAKCTPAQPENSFLA